MEIADALRKAQRILYQERNEPTVDYIDPLIDWNKSNKPSATQAQVTKALAARQRYDTTRKNLYTERGERPRNVHESPDEYIFKSSNFDMLHALFGQLSAAQRPEFIKKLLECIDGENVSSCLGANARFPCYQRSMSELPLVGEFCIRMGFLKELLNAIAISKQATTGLVVLFYQLEEIVALNFTSFSETDLESMVDALSPLIKTCREIIDRFNSTPRNRLSNEIHEAGIRAIEIVNSITGLNEECKKALHYYLKNQLSQEAPNLEIENDRTKVIGFLDSLGFSPNMAKALDAAERDYRATSTAFELKNALSHLRSFLEHLHRDAAKAISQKTGDAVTDRWGEATVYLRQHGYFTRQHEEFVAKLYTLLSDESVHPLTADREYARLLRNVTIEYGVMFLTVLDKKGVIITDLNS